ncbi:hypothetical protein POM88_001910 [Heracleum sosnowskyi]|uniref:Protein kinase domain-containing protein n=1 Tax=Heracleum sosnowskyi TaxID=360622 RepID=A0AAD8JD66_9APIA|nr:hypothetical protein POM88_001910 [Heracleum sosnowskyi]
MSCSLYLVFEYMEHDLAGLAASPGIKFTVEQVKCYRQQLLSGLEHCHKRNVLHRDIKGSNLLLDNGGVLKIADFWLATVFNPNHKHPMTSRVVTLWYRPPELLLGATDYSVGIDLWSAGCILAELLAGKPIMTGRTERTSSGRYKKPCNSNSQASLYLGLRFLTSMGNHISKTNTAGTSSKMNFANLSTSRKLVAAALHDADVISRQDGVVILSSRGEDSSVADQLVISLELSNGGNGDPVLLPSIVNVSICGPEPSPSTTTNVFKRNHQLTIF